MSVLSEQLKTYRLRHNYTQRMLAGRLGISTSVLTSYEHGSRLPSYDRLLAMSKEMHVSTDALLGNTPLADESAYLNIDGLSDNQVRVLSAIVEQFRIDNGSSDI